MPNPLSRIVKVGSVIQVNEKADELAGCLFIVGKVEDWGVRAYTSVPFQDSLYFSFAWEQLEYIGLAALVQKEEPQSHQKPPNFVF